jgi:hypothetical protein
MTEAEKEDLLIRRILIAAPVVLVAGFLVTVVSIAVMVSCNFNFLNWVE